MRFTLVLFLIHLFTYSILAASHKESLSAEQAYEMLRKNPSLAEKIIIDLFDMSEIASNNNTAEIRPEFSFKNVDFNAGITAKNKAVASNFRFNKCKIQMIDAKSTTWYGRIVFERCGVNGFANFKENKFRAETNFYSVHFGEEAWFEGSLFESTAEFLGCIWERKFDFSDTTFLKQAIFKKSVFKEEAYFHAAIFEEDVSFIEFKAAGKKNGNTLAIFLNVFFKGDAEFRFCKFDHVNFSNKEYITVFYKLADFRGCQIKSASFDYIETRGVANFVQANFGKGGVSFDNSVLSGPLINLDSVQCSGHMILNNAYIPNIQFSWSEIGTAIVSADPKPKASELKTLWRRLKALGRKQEALKMHYDVSNRAREELLNNPKASLADQIWTIFEWIVWGLPTGYGTKLGRILLITGIFWIVFSLPPLVKRGILVSVPPSRKEPQEKSERKALKPHRYSPMYLNEIPTGTNSPVSVGQHVYLAMAYTFGLMFKLGGRGIAYIEIERGISFHGFERYFIIVWFAGSVLMALMVFTLTNTSPALSKIIGEIII